MGYSNSWSGLVRYQPAERRHLGLHHFHKGNEFIIGFPNLTYILNYGKHNISEKNLRQTRLTQSKRQGFLTWIRDLQT